jgi:hypothetical protein
MSDMGFTPNFTAASAINPFRFVEINTTTPFTGQKANAASDNILGVTDGSVRRFDATAHANAGEQISLQPTNTVQVEAGAAINTIGALLTSDADGRAVAGASGNICFYMALETAGAAGEIIRAFRFGTRAV